MIVLGIDPGVDGAIARVELVAGQVFLDVVNIPTLVKSVKGAAGAAKLRRIVDVAGLLDLLTRQSVLGATAAFVEEVGGLPGQSGPAAFSFGFGAGLIRMGLHSVGMPVTYVSAAKWKGDMRAPKDKKASIARACELAPLYAPHFREGGDVAKRSGRAEAVMIAMWGLRHGGA